MMMGFDLILIALIGAAAYAFGWRPQLNQTKPAETSQTEVYCIEHDFNRDEHQDDVSACQETEHPDSEQDSAQSQNRTDRHNHAAFLLARTTAPMIAARRSRDAISNGSANGPKSAMPIAARLPWG